MQTNFPNILVAPSMTEIGHINLPHFSFETAEAIVSRDKNDLLDQGKNLPDLQYSAYRHQVHVAIMKIQGVLTCMKLAGKSPEHMRMEAERQLKTLRESMGQFLTNSASYKDQSTESRNQLEQSRLTVFNTKVNFSLLTPSTEDKPKTEPLLNRFKEIVTNSFANLTPPKMFGDRVFLEESKVGDVALKAIIALLGSVSMLRRIVASTFDKTSTESSIHTFCLRRWDGLEIYRLCIALKYLIREENHRLGEKTPYWINKSSDKGHMLLERFDTYMVKEFNTFPGEAKELIRELLLNAIFLVDRHTPFKVFYSIIKADHLRSVLPNLDEPTDDLLQSENELLE